MKSKAVALFLSLGLATTVAACAGQTEAEQTPPAPTIQDDGEEGGAPPGAIEEGEEGEEGEGGES